MELTGAWSGLADALLVRAALTARLGWDRAPNPLAGYSLSDEEVDALLRALPGLDREPPALLEDDVRKVVDDAEAAVDDARAELRLGLDDGGRFATVCRHAGLDLAGAEVLGLLLAVEVDTRRQRLVGYLADDVTQRRLTVWTLRLVAGDAGVALAGPGGPLRRAGLLVPAGPGAWAAEPVAVAPTVSWWLAGDDGPDPALPHGTEVLEVPYAADAPLEAGRIVVGSGRDRVRRLQSVAGGLLRPSLLITPKPAGPDAWDAVIRWATLTGSGVVVEIDGDDELGAEGRDRIERAWHVPWGIASRTDLAVADLPQRPWLEAPSIPELASADEWAGAFGGVAPDGADLYRLTAEQLLYVSRASGAVGGDLAAAVRRLAGPVQGTATRIRPTRTWDDLILDAERRQLVAEIAIRCRQRRRVLRRLGPRPAAVDGCGGPLPRAVRYRQDLGRRGDRRRPRGRGVQGRPGQPGEQVHRRDGEEPVGQSSMPPRRAAWRCSSTRPTPSSASGRRSPTPTTATPTSRSPTSSSGSSATTASPSWRRNLLRNIDDAFLRRIHVIVEFPVPEAPERRRIWRRCLPPNAPLADDLDLDVFADGVEMVGGTIRNTVATAAFLAAEEERRSGRSTS